MSWKIAKELKMDGHRSRSFMIAKQRVALGKILDRKLAGFFNKLEKKRQSENWTEEKWEQELDNHPFVMKTTAQSSEAAQLADYLTSLMYQPNGLAPVDRPISYKEAGNFSYRRHYYSIAILSYTQGLKERCDNADLNARLYSNKAAAHYKIKNYYSALYDSEQASYLITHYTKALVCAAKSAMELGEWDTCTGHCMNIALIQPRNQKLITKITNRARTKRYLYNLNMAAKILKTTGKREILAKVITENGVRVINLGYVHGHNWDLIPGGNGVHVHKISGRTKRSIILHYPEEGETEYIKGCLDDIPIVTQLKASDRTREYTLSTFYIFVEGIDGKPHLIDDHKTINNLLTNNILDFKQDPPIFIMIPFSSISALSLYEVCEVRDGGWHLNLYIMPKEGTRAG